MAKKPVAKQTKVKVSEGAAAGNQTAALLAAWAVPGAGHLLLGKRRRALIFFFLVLTMLVIGLLLRGELPQGFGGPPLQQLRSLACLGLGLPYFILRLVGYEGVIDSAGFEYGCAFIQSSALMNLLLLLDVWDVGQGNKP